MKYQVCRPLTPIEYGSGDVADYFSHNNMILDDDQLSDIKAACKKVGVFPLIANPQESNFAVWWGYVELADPRSIVVDAGWESYAKALVPKVPCVVSSVVYFIQSKAGGPIKIGTTTELARRFATIQSMNPFPIRVIKAINGDEKLEARIHNMFAGSRLHGEWFGPTRRLIDFIDRQEAAQHEVPSL